MDYLAIGLDPAKVTLFKQSDVTEHTELAWIFNCLTTMPYLARAHAFKDAEAKNKEINVGLFDYPILMAADILMYDADIVPVGQDQKQHIEITRDTAEKFNRIYGETFKLPEPLIIPNVQTIPGIDGQKMSKSYNNHIPLFSSDDEIRKSVMSIVTDSSGETPKNVYALHKLFRSESELATLYEEKKGKYKDLKEALAADIISFVAPLRERREAIAAEPEKVRAVLQEGAAVTRDLASKKMKTVREKIGLSL
jgi:tryptophanyl-tRNA synthetase